MTEDEWNACTDCLKMLAHGKASDRKIRLFMAGYIRSWCVTQTRPFPPTLGAIADLLERHADGEAITEDQYAGNRSYQSLARKFCSFSAYDVAKYYGRFLGSVVPPPQAAAVVRDLLGPLPFRTVTIPAAVLEWHDGCVVKLATSIYEEREMPSGALNAGRLAVLADALEEVGLSDQEVLQHFREQGAVHHRGCWPIDLLLGKT
jgi:hypothetical protein